MSDESDRFSARAARHLRVGAHVGGAAARIAGARLLGGSIDDAQSAAALAAALGRLKGPLMKVAQMLATIPDALPPEYAESLAQLQAQAPPMGSGFRQAAHAGGTGRRLAGQIRRLRSCASAAAASLGPSASARKPRTGERSPASCNIPTWPRRSKPICKQLDIILALHRRMRPAIDTREVAQGNRRAPARRARLSPRGAPCDALCRDSRALSGDPRAARRREPLDGASAQHGMAGGPAFARLSVGG